MSDVFKKTKKYKGNFVLTSEEDLIIQKRIVSLFELADTQTKENDTQFLHVENQKGFQLEKSPMYGS